MRTTFDVDPGLLKEVEKLMGAKSSKALNAALAELIRLKRKERLLASLGQRDLDIDDWYEFRHNERS
jgi:hypothetical protein